ncbi:radical SAM family heme chaperone HemW [Paenibacillus sp. GCM10012307]|uniref:Heme chaperone HemW n=1 Tax=Paenibacillus roseus TaxID=2798579 RepID=A0A934MSA6_9BACL|nr:radical SAM family heme chaperone HemW [Paenibacillus roseus]MBJ6363084.1 oxygen-independent coproporphyrinogen III oxidase [Paenibacillus roseus]
MITTSPRALYIHIPFCTNKCFYCDFNSFVLKGQPVEDYLEALEQEMKWTVEQIKPQMIDTVFVGGGTPTVLTPPQMELFLSAVKRHFPLSEQVEFTMEANPGTTDLDKLQVMRDGGVNRISFGVQSFDNKLLERIGRIHNVDDVYRSIENARSIGFTNLSIDLMFNLPDQTLETLDESVSRALALELPHYSLYGLKIEENTLFHTLYQRDELPLPSEDEELEMYLLIMNRLKNAGRHQYEISNFALPGYESRHNMTYWRNEPYYGMGAGAHGYHHGERHINIKGVQPYIDAARQQLPRLETRQVEPSEAMEDFMMVGLRMLDGVTADRFHSQFPGIELRDVFGETIDRLIGSGLLQYSPTEKRYRLSERGVPLGNEVFGAFLS